MTRPDPGDPLPEALSDLPLGLLLGRVSGAFRARLLALCPEAGDDVRLVGLLLAIGQSPDATQADHARYLGIDLNTASRLVTRAEVEGFVERVPSPADRRAHLLRRTPRGQDLAARGAAAVRAIEDDISDRLGKDRLDTLRETAVSLLGLLT
jgi:DNA-binding MarR family transcriptional regulator